MVAAYRRAQGRDRTLALAVSAVLHAVVLGLVLWSLGRFRQFADAPVMKVELTPWRHAQQKPDSRPRRSGQTRPQTHKVSGASASIEPAPGTPAPGPSAPAPPTSGSAETRPALRGLLGCEHAAMLKLSPEERERCEERMAQAGPGEGPARLNLDRRGDLGRNPEPYLQRRPTKGCKPRAAGDASVMGQEGVAAGVTCGWAF